MSGLVVDISAPHRDADELYLQVSGQKASGWERIEVTLLAEAFPNRFDIAASAVDPATGAVASINPGDECVVYLGDDVVITGYVDQVVDSGNADSHGLQITGRGKTQDLVDCSAEWPTGQMVQGSLLTIATQLAALYGIPVSLASGANASDPVPGWALNYGETGAEIIQRLARAAGLLAYEDSRGQLVLANASDTAAASGVAYGTNVQSWSAERSLLNRMQTIVCSAYAMDAYADFVGGGTSLGAAEFYHIASDPGVTRHRLRYLVQEHVVRAQEFTTMKADWEAARNAARGNGISVIVDSWRDSGGTLWTPNTTLPVSLPGVTAAGPFSVSEVTFRRNDQEGTVAELSILPQFGLKPEPLSLQPLETAGLHQ